MRSSAILPSPENLGETCAQRVTSVATSRRASCSRFEYPNCFGEEWGGLTMSDGLDDACRAWEWLAAERQAL